MPLPEPSKDELKNQEEDKFVGRCKNDDVMKKEFKDEKQRLAVCYDIWEEANKKQKE